MSATRSWFGPAASERRSDGSVADYTKNVKHWRGGGMILRCWAGAAVVEASKGFRKIRGHHDPSQLVLAL